MPEANTMEPVKTALVDSFIKYITGVYLLQQEFIDDMQGGLQSVLEKYNVSPIGADVVVEAVQEQVAVAAKKTRKKSNKKEAKAEATVMETPAEEASEEVRAEVEEAVVEASEEASEEAEPEVGASEEVSIPTHVESALNNEVVEKKKRKPRAKKGEVAGEPEEPKKKRPITAYRVFVTEFSKTEVCKGLSMANKGPLMSAEWAIIKDDPEKLKVYEEKAVEINRENGL